MQGETCNDWVDRSIRAAVGGLADFLGLIGRNWLSVLGWSLFTMAISEPARAFGEQCDGDGGVGMTGLYAAARAHRATLPPYQAHHIVGVFAVACPGGGTGACYECQQRDPSGAVWFVCGALACASCSETEGAEEMSQPNTWAPQCVGGCVYAPTEPKICYNVCVTQPDGTEVCSQDCRAGMQPTGGTCDMPPLEEEEQEPEPDIPEPEPECQTNGDGVTFCVKPDKQCDGYSGLFNGRWICVPGGDENPPCNGPFCDSADPPGDADNEKDENGDESNEDEPTDDVRYWYQEDGHDPVEDVDWFIPGASETGGCGPCPPAGDPQDPRDSPPGGGGEEGGEDPGDTGGGTGGGSGGEQCDPETETCDDTGGGTGGEECDPETETCDETGGGEDTGGGGTGGEEQCDPDVESCGDNTDGGGGTGGGEEPGGECDPYSPAGCPGEGEASGGASCGAPPLCSGDPVTCMVAYQAWETRCAVTDLEDRIFDTEDMDDSTGTENVQPPDIQPFDTGSISFDDSGWLGGGGSCPDWTVSVMGSSFNLDESGHLCRFLQIGAGLVLVFAAWASARIIAGGVS